MDNLISNWLWEAICGLCRPYERIDLDPILWERDCIPNWPEYLAGADPLMNEYQCRPIGRNN